MRILQTSTLWHFYKPDSPAARLEGSPLFSQSRTFAKWVFSRAPLSFGSSLEFSSVLTPLSCLFLVLPCYLSGCGGLASNLPFSLLWRCNTFLIGRVFGCCDLIFTTGNGENIANKCINKLAVKTWAARAGNWTQILKDYHWPSGIALSPLGHRLGCAFWPHIKFWRYVSLSQEGSILPSYWR